MENNSDNGVKFGGGRATSVAGVISGVLFATGVSYVFLNYGQILPQSVVTGIVIAAVALGGMISLVSAFFGLVMPTSVHGRWHDHNRRE